MFIRVHPWLKLAADVESFIRNFGGRDVALRRPRPVQGRNTSASVAKLHASRSAQLTDPTFADRLDFGGQGARLCEPQHFRNARAMEFFHTGEMAEVLRVADPRSVRIRVHLRNLRLRKNG